MFRETEIFETTARFTYEPQSVPLYAQKSPLASFYADEDVGALKHVYSEIARRLSRNAYTSHTVAHAL
jgi:hypothetical protein